MNIEEEIRKLKATLRAHITSHKYIDDRDGSDANYDPEVVKINTTCNKQLEMLDG